MTSSLRAGLALLLLALGTVRLGAQGTPPADSLPFHAGQWGAQFTVGDDVRSVGVLRFVSRRAALLLDARADVGTSRRELNGASPAGVTTTETTRRLSAELRLGWRRYRSLGARAAAFHTLGVLGGVNGARIERDGAERGRTDGHLAGAFGELGGVYFVTPRLSLGATGALDARAAWQRSRTQGSTERRRDLALEASVPSIVVALYF